MLSSAPIRYLLSTLLFGFGTAFSAAAQTTLVVPNTKIKVYLVGTFHFNGSTTDVVKGSKSDMSTAQKQQEIEELVSRLKKTKADKVFVEWKQPRQRFVDSTYALYRSSKFTLGNNEVYQVGYRLANKLNCPRVYCADADGEWNYDEAVAYATQHGQSQVLERNGFGNDSLGLLIRARIQAIYPPKPAPKKATTPLTITQIIASNNTDDARRDNMDAYLLRLARVGGGDNYVGADLAGEFYKRNMRIYTNLLRAVDVQHDKAIVLIIGAGHVSFLKEQLQHNSLFEVQDVGPLLSGK